MAKRWLDPESVTVPVALQKAIGGHPLVVETLVRRGITTADEARLFLGATEYVPASPRELPGMDLAVGRIQVAIERHEQICVWGDFDVDGQTSTALLVSALYDLGANVIYHIPNRFDEGHGIALHTLKQVIDDGAQVLLTCDTGIAAVDAVAYANSRGVDVVITDHHSLPDAFPEAFAIVNPQFLREHHPLRELPGVGTAYQLVKTLYRDMPSDHLLDLVAMGIVADVMLQVDDTRYFLQRGLDVLRNTQRLGLQEMMAVAEVNPEEVNEQHIGFVLAPRLNALGRLEDANPAVELLTSTDLAGVRILVNQLEALNSRRKFLSQQVYEGAMAQIERDPSMLEYAALVLEHPDWHTGVVGIVANRLVEEFNRPVVLIATPDGEIGHGSARSIEGCNITQAIAAQSDLLQGFGGHNMAAGLSLPAENIYDFRRGLSVTVRAMLGDVDTTPSLRIDGFLPLKDISMELVEELDRLAPFGNGNPPLTLATRDVFIQKKSQLGRRGEHIQLMLEDDSGETQRVVYWRGADAELPEGRFDLAYTVRASHYKGKTEVMVEWQDARPTDSSPIVIDMEPVEVEVIDLRGMENPEDILVDYPNALIWREAETIRGVTRYHLHPTDTLLIWTQPPGINEWLDALETVKPQQLVLVGVNPGVDTLDPFLKRLAGLVKFAVNRKDGYANLQELSAAMAHREQTVEVGLQWLAERGQITVEPASMNRLRFTLDGDASGNGPTEYLNSLLKETRAYRAFWRMQKHEISYD